MAGQVVRLAWGDDEEDPDSRLQIETFITSVPEAEDKTP